MVDYNRVVLFGGSHPEKGETNDVYILDLTRMVSYSVPRAYQPAKGEEGASF